MQGTADLVALLVPGVQVVIKAMGAADSFDQQQQQQLRYCHEHCWALCVHTAQHCSEAWSALQAALRHKMQLVLVLADELNAWRLLPGDCCTRACQYAVTQQVWCQAQGEGEVGLLPAVTVAHECAPEVDADAWQQAVAYLSDLHEQHLLAAHGACSVNEGVAQQDIDWQTAVDWQT